MKRHFIFAVMSAVTLMGLTAVTSCSSSSDEVENVNPGYDPATGEVPVNFVLNVSTGNVSSTRMSESVVQATSSNHFRGMDQSSLMSYKVAGMDGKYLVTPTAADKRYALGTIFDVNSVGPTETHSQRILELSLPVETNILMFWGKAKKSSGSNADNEEGKIVFDVKQNPAETSFKLCQRVPDDASVKYNKNAFLAYTKLLTTILNIVVQTKIVERPVQYNGNSPVNVTLEWAAYGEDTDASGNKILKLKSTSTDKDPSDATRTEPLCALGEKLSEAFVTLNTIHNTSPFNELRAGSGPAVERTLSDLYAVINSVAEATPTSFEEAVAQTVAKEVRDNLIKALDTSTGTKFQPINDIVTHLGASLVLGETSLPTGTDDDNNLEKFPSIFGLPEGSTVLLYDVANRSYSYRTSIPTYDMGGGDEFNIFNYMYPPELCYFGNSPIRVTDAEVLPYTASPQAGVMYYPDGSANWDEDANWTGWTTGTSAHVTSTTRSVAMQYNIKYGTSLLKTTVRYGSNELEDNNYFIQKQRNNTTENNNKIDVTTSKFALTGVLIGGQNTTVGWDYLVKSGESGFDAMVYDNVLNEENGVSAGVIPGATSTTGGDKSKPNYTLVWDNWDESCKDNNQHVIYLALEFINNGDDFWGENNLIRKGGKFYITGALDPNTNTSDRSSGISWPTKYALPPYDDTDGSTIKQRRVFIQDYVTEANFVIGKYSLQKALIAVPDLRSAQMSVGLSVDMKWSEGLKFEDVVLGGGGSGNTPSNP